MKNLLFFFVLLLAVVNSAKSQHASVKGSVKDTSNKKDLQYSVVAVLRKSDSVLVGYSRTNQGGNFIVKNLPREKLIVWITHPTFADYVEEILIKDTSVLDLGTVNLTTKSQLLQEVIVKQQLGAIRFKGDTTEFIADSFKVRPNASVEDLLRTLPGIQVTKDGKISAQGQTIEKVLVDGEEFFGDDPTIATQNLRADALEKVQVFDKKSDQAAFTGIDDGQSKKTLNLKLKENKKNGYFGKVTLGAGPKNFWNNNGMINSFKGKRKVSAFGIMSNTGKTGLDWNEQSNYGGGNNMEYMEEYGGFVSFGNYDQDFGGPTYYGEGLPSSWSGGLHFSNKWRADKNNFNSSYLFNKLNNAGTSGTFTQTILPDTLYFTNQRSTNFDSRLRHSLNAMFEIQIDSSSSVKISTRGSLGKSLSDNSLYTESLNSSSNMVNRSNRNVSSNGENASANTTALWRKKFKKKGRTISWNLQQDFRKNTSSGFLNAVNEYFAKSGLISLSDTVDQKKLNESQTFTLDTRATYTEPLSKTAYLEVNYGVATSNSTSRRTTLDEAGGIYAKRIDSLSNEYAFNILTNSGGLALRIVKKKYNFSLGSNLSYSDFEQTDLRADTNFNYSFINLFPKANFVYSFTQFKRLSFNYNGNTRQPSLTQLQPLRDNTDPLSIYIGNPDLKQEFRNSFRLTFNDYKVLNQRSVYANISLTNVSNAISNSDRVDSLGRRVFQSINVNGSYNINAYAGYGYKIKVLDLSWNNNLSYSAGQMINFINGRKNENKNENYSIRTSFYKNKAKKYHVGLSSSITYTTSTSSIRKDVVTKFWSQTHNVYGNVDLPLKTEFNTDCDFNFRQRTSVFDRNNNVIRWNASLGKKLFKNDVGLLKLSVFDILDQNIGFRRNVTSNYVYEKTYETLRRYFLLSFTLNFSKNGKPSQF